LEKGIRRNKDVLRTPRIRKRRELFEVLSRGRLAGKKKKITKNKKKKHNGRKAKREKRFAKTISQKKK